MAEPRMAAPLRKLVNLMGEERGRRVYAETLAALELTDISSPNDSARFGEHLIRRGGVFASIGRAIKIQAILHGADTDG